MILFGSTLLGAPLKSQITNQNISYSCQSVLNDAAHRILDMMKWCWCNHRFHVIQAAFPRTSCWLLNATSSCSTIEMKYIFSTGLSKENNNYLLKDRVY